MPNVGFAIIAAGLGSRLKAENVTQPKPMVCLGGEPMIGRLIGIMRGAGADSVSVIVNTGNIRTAEYLKSNDFGLTTNLLVEDTPGSMHSLYRLYRMLESRQQTPDRLIVTTVDTVFRPSEFCRYVDAARLSDAHAFMGVTPFIDDEKPLYVGVARDNSITGFYDDRHGCSYVSAGVYGLTRKALSVLEHTVAAGETRMRAYQRAILSAGLTATAFNLGKVVDVDHIRDIETAKSILE